MYLIIVSYFTPFNLFPSIQLYITVIDTWVNVHLGVIQKVYEMLKMNLIGVGQGTQGHTCHHKISNKDILRVMQL